MATTAEIGIPVPGGSGQFQFKVLGALSFSHLLNDMLQSLLLAMYPLFKGEFSLSFAQIGLITLTYQVTASLLQPLIGLYADRNPRPYSLSAGMCLTLAGLLTLAWAHSFHGVLLAAALVGSGSSVFHPESSRIARLASGGRHGLAQSIFQIGGNTGSAIGPLLAAAIILPYGQKSVAWFGLAALMAIAVLWQVGGWYKRHLADAPERGSSKPVHHALPSRTVAWSIAILVLLVFSKYFYLASLSSYYSFYLIEKFGLSVRSSQLHLFLFLFAVAIGTLLGGPIGDRIGRKHVIWVSILGVAPFSLLLPYANLPWTVVLTFVIGVTISSAFSAIVVFAQELIPGRVGAVSGLFFGFAFGVGGIAAAVLGSLADSHGIAFVFRMCAYLPLLGVATTFLPDIKECHPQSA
jgi:FSR family fosmidomycin resistance protein-like MFS transporter